MSDVLWPTCLIVSTVNDEHVHAVVSCLSEDTTPLILDFSKYCVEFVATFSSPSSIQLRLDASSGDVVVLDRVESVWWRRPQPFSIPPNLASPDAVFMRAEYEHFWTGALACFDSNVRWYNSPDATSVADRKLYQLQLARSIGLRVPATVVTGHPDVASAFIRSQRACVYKSFRGNQGAWEPTRVVCDNFVSNIHAIVRCPVVLQEYIDGVADWRITVIDDFCQAVRFDITKSRYKWDVRIDMATPCEAAQLPDTVLGKLKLFMSQCGLRYSAFDLRQTADNEFVFFEVNPAGQFLYLDIQARTRISEAMANALSHDRNLHDYPKVHIEHGGNRIEIVRGKPLALSLEHISHLTKSA